MAILVALQHAVFPPAKSCPDVVVKELIPCCSASCALSSSSCTQTSGSICTVARRSHSSTT